MLERLQTPDSILQLLRLSRGTLEMLKTVERRLIHQLRNDPRLHRRVQLLMSIRGVGEVLALTWALEAGEVQRLASIRKAHGYCA